MYKLHAFKNCFTCSCFISFYAFQRVFFATFILIRSYFISGFSAGNNNYV